MKKKLAYLFIATQFLMPVTVLAENLSTTESTIQTDDIQTEATKTSTEDSGTTKTSLVPDETETSQSSVAAPIASPRATESVEPVEPSMAEQTTERIFFNGEWIEMEAEPAEISALDNEAPAIITEENQSVLGHSLDLPMRISAASNRALSTDKKLPRMDFIDVASHQGTISVNDYLNMKRQGVTGVVVKLTEGTTYRNKDFAASQIKNAKAAGLKVSAYHYSHFRTRNEAIAEARYFAKYAKELGLDSSTVMVNDAEEAKTNNKQLTNNSIYFAATLANEFGYKKVVHYSMASWFTKDILDMSRLGGDKFAWKAEVPNNPSKDNLLHTGSAAWQWGHHTKFVGDSVPGRIFDTNIDHTKTFSSGELVSITPFSKRVLINKDYGSIYANPYLPGVVKQGTTAKLNRQSITLTAQSQTNYGLWYQFAYKENGVNKVGWIKSVDVSDVLDHKNSVATLYLNKNNGAVYANAYTAGTKKIDTTVNFKNDKFTVSKEALTAYGLWYYGSYIKNNQTKYGWIKSVDLSTETTQVLPYSRRVLINKNYGSIYEKPYIRGVAKLGTTAQMNRQAIILTAKGQTSFGLWYQFAYKENGVNKVGWIKSVDVSDVLDQKNSATTLYLNKSNGAVYANAYTAGTKKIDTTSNFKNDKFTVSEEALTAYGLWHYGSYIKNNQTKYGWIKSIDLSTETAQILPYNRRVLINKNYGAIYAKPYVRGVAKLGTTAKMNRQSITLTAKAQTSFGLWYQFAYKENGINKVGWIKSVDVNDILDQKNTKKTLYVNKNYGAVYANAYIAGTKKLDTTANFSQNKFTVTKEARTAYGLWYYGSYQKNNQTKYGWIKSVDFR